MQELKALSARDRASVVRMRITTRAGPSPKHHRSISVTTKRVFVPLCAARIRRASEVATEKVVSLAYVVLLCHFGTNLSRSR